MQDDPFWERGTCARGLVPRNGMGWVNASAGVSGRYRRRLTGSTHGTAGPPEHKENNAYAACDRSDSGARCRTPPSLSSLSPKVVGQIGVRDASTRCGTSPEPRARRGVRRPGSRAATRAVARASSRVDSSVHGQRLPEATGDPSPPRVSNSAHSHSTQEPVAGATAAARGRRTSGCVVDTEMPNTPASQHR